MLHCHLRSPIPPVILGFNHRLPIGTHRALTYRVSNLAKLNNPRLCTAHFTSSLSYRPPSWIITLGRFLPFCSLWNIVLYKYAKFDAHICHAFEKRNSKLQPLAIYFYIMFQFDHEGPCGINIASTHQFSAKSDNPRLTYYKLTIPNIVSIRHLVFDGDDRKWVLKILRPSASGRKVIPVSWEIKFIRIFARDHPQPGR